MKKYSGEKIDQTAINHASEKNLLKSKDAQMTKADVIVFVLLIVCFAIRLFFCVDTYDEAFNIGVSFKTVLGAKHLIENTYLFQTGNFFNLPFVWLFYVLTGGMSGIILYLRFCYLGLNFLLAYLFYRQFKEVFTVRTAFLFSLTIITVAPSCMYTIWYDSAALYFMLMGMFFLLGILIKESSRKSVWIAGIAAGICHGCMAYAYPLMILLIPVLIAGVYVFIRGEKKRNSFKATCSFLAPYVIGGCMVLAIVILYILYQGPQNFFLLKKDAFATGLSGRVLGSITQSESIEITENTEIIYLTDEISIHMVNATTMQRIVMQVGCRLALMVFKNLHQQRHILLFMIPLLIQYVLACKKYPKMRKWLAWEILVVGFVDGVDGSDLAHMGMYCFYFMWAPLMYRFVPQEKKKIGKALLCIMWYACVPAVLAVGFSASFPRKSCMGFYSGGIAGLLIILLCVQECREVVINEKKYKFSERRLLAIMFAVSNVIVYYCNVMHGGEIWECRHFIKKGVYTGLWAAKEDERVEIIEERVTKLLDGGKPDSVGYSSQDDAWVYLWTEKDWNFLSTTKWEFASPQGVCDTIMYGDVQDVPQLLLISRKTEEQKIVLETVYDCVYEDEFGSVYLMEVSDDKQ